MIEVKKKVHPHNTLTGEKKERLKQRKTVVVATPILMNVVCVLNVPSGTNRYAALELMIARIESRLYPTKH